LKSLIFRERHMIATIYMSRKLVLYIMLRRLIMARPAERPKLKKKDAEILRKLSNSTTKEVRMVLRAKVIIMSSEGLTDRKIAERLRISHITVAKWRKRYISDGIDGLNDHARSGAPQQYDKKEILDEIIDLLEEKPPEGRSAWDGVALAKELGISKDIVQKVLRDNGIRLHKHRT
jgi:transposase